MSSTAANARRELARLVMLVMMIMMMMYEGAITLLLEDLLGSGTADKEDRLLSGVCANALKCHLSIK